MATRAVLGTLTVAADLDIRINGQRARLTGSGSALRLEVASPAHLLAEVRLTELPVGLRSVTSPYALGRLAGTLSDHGVSLEIVGPAGRLIRIGQGSTSRLGRILTGNSAVHLGAVRAVAPTVGAVIRQFGRRVLARVRRPRVGRG